jgi:biopolymer transport protein ExbB/TolQ
MPLPWARKDIEQRLGFCGARFTDVNTKLTAIAGAILTVAFYAILYFLGDSSLGEFTRMFTERGPTPYAICFFSFWSLAILVIKWRKIVFQRKVLNYSIVPDEADFVLSAGTTDVVVNNIYSIVDEPKHFVLFNRIMVALSNLRNLGRVTDVEEILRSQAENDEAAMESSYTLVSGFVWAIPVLGFIGTVLGLSSAIGGFAPALENSHELSMLKDSLRDVTGGLATAFETTLEALVAALIIQLLITFLRKSEEDFLDSCSSYCLRNVVNRLRIMIYEEDKK